MGLAPDQIRDFVTNTFPHVRKDKWKDISLDRQHHIVTQNFLSNGKFSSKGGQYLQEQLQVRNTGTYEHTGWYAPAKTKVVDLTETAQVPWCMARVSYAYSIYEDVWQQGPQQILRYISVRKHSMYNDLIDGMETDAFGGPTSPTEKPRRPWGLTHWFQRAASGQKTFGHHGQNPSGFTDMAGLDATVHSNWRNGTFEYATFGQLDFYSKLSEAIIKCHFRAPRSYAELDGGKAQYALYTTYPVLEQFHLAQTASNDNLQMDIGKYRSTPLFRGIPIEWVPAITNEGSAVRDTTNPIYGVDKSSWHMFFREGKEKHLHAPMRDSNQPDVEKVYMDVQWNWMMTDRRKNFIGYQAAA